MPTIPSLTGSRSRTIRRSKDPMPMPIPVSSYVVDCAVYVDGQRLPGHWTHTEAVAEVRKRGAGFVWIGLHGFDFLRRVFGHGNYLFVCGVGWHRKLFSTETTREASGCQTSRLFGNVLIWTAATRRRFPTTRHVASLQSADMSAHSKLGHYPLRH